MGQPLVQYIKNTRIIVDSEIRIPKLEIRNKFKFLNPSAPNGCARLSQDPNDKHQMTNKDQTTNPKSQTGERPVAQPILNWRP